MGDYLQPLVDGLRLYNVIGAAWVLAWSVKMYRVRKAQRDDYWGEYLALALSLFLLGDIIGSAQRLYERAPFTIAGLLAAIAVSFVILARYRTQKGAP